MLGNLISEHARSQNSFFRGGWDEILHSLINGLQKPANESRGTFPRSGDELCKDMPDSHVGNPQRTKMRCVPGRMARLLCLSHLCFGTALVVQALPACHC